MKNIFPLILLLFFASCSNFTGKRTDLQTQNLFVLDSLWTPTGDVKLDSLFKLASTTPQDSILAKLFFEIADNYYLQQNDLAKAKDWYLRANALSEKLHWYRGFYLFASKYTNIINAEGLIDSSIVIHKRTLELAKEENNEKWIAITLTNLGNAYSFINWNETALKYHHEAVKIFEKRNDPYKLAQVYNLMGIAYRSLDMYDEQLALGEKALKLLNEKPDTIFRASVLINYANALVDKYDYENAENYYMEALRVSELNKHRNYILTTYGNLARLAVKRFDLDKAEMYRRKSLDLGAEKFAEKYCHLYLGLSDIELYRGNLIQAEEYLELALKKSIECNFSDLERACYNSLGLLEYARRDYKKYQFYTEKSNSLQKILKGEQVRQTVKEMEIKYETEKKELEIERQLNIIEKQNMQRNMFIGAIVLCVLILALLWSLLRLRIRRNRELAEMNLTKDKFFNIISHDLKNPAIAQRDALKILVKNAGSWDAEKLAEYHLELLKSADGEVELLFNLLSWSQLQTGRMRFTPETLVLTDIIPSLLLIQKMAENKNILLDIQIPENALVIADVKILTTIIRNLLTNAVKFTPKGGKISLWIEPTTDQKYRISITDTGVGMSQTQIYNLFRLDTTNSNLGTAGEQGSGLGLIVCKELIEKHGSKLFVESEENKGSKFWFII